MVSKKNPFEVLGFTPDIIRNLSDEDVAVLVKSQYRTLQQIYHPDRPGGDEERSREINLAYELLDSQRNPQSYIAFKELFLRQTPIRKKLSELEEVVTEEKNRRERLFYKFIWYIRNFFDFEGEMTVFNIAPARLQMYDTALGMSRDVPISISISEAEIDENKKAFQYSLILRENNGVVEERRGKSIEYENKRLIGTIPEHVVADLGGIKEVLMPSQRLRRAIMGSRATGFPRELRYFENRIEPPQFYEILELLGPQITKNSYLFSINKEGREIYFSLEGRIMKIEEER